MPIPQRRRKILSADLSLRAWPFDETKGGRRRFALSEGTAIVRAGRIFAVILAIVVVAGLAFFALAWRPSIAPEDPAQRTEFDPALVKRGAELAAVGNCTSCHTVPGQRSFAGGLAIPTPFGAVYSTNITPDADTGIGRWSEAAFQRAMREGVDREGDHLYPAFPYDHFTRVSDEDNKALYAFLMTREPVSAAPRANDLVFPLNVRPIVAGWKLLYFDEGVFRPDPNQSDEWNRGAYLAEGLGHCGACHTPRNALGAEDAVRHFAGGMAEGWNAYAIDENSPAPIPWDKESLAFYLRHGWHSAHGVSRGPMAEVTGNLGPLPDSDIDAIAAYVLSLMGEPSAERRQQADALIDEVAGEPGTASAAEPNQQDNGAAIYASACSSCHDNGRALPFGGLNFALSSAVNAPNPQNIVNVTLFGLPAADGEPSAVMPGFAGVLTDEQVAELLNFMRAQFADRPPWEGVAEMARATRTGQFKVAIRPSDGIERAPVNVGAED
jgi:mono/diheme cytochrome c family protein